ncbi:hypothetical protein EVAR_87843_1 [Eumeta japonica]|uniref:Uncharacterized protein n=1 Tax=Eumeta variegata TaxID=151549 RepID=A0A4C1YD78_EUMVA|nr:hypothetical protein EVAR_87843_1 [Eumeta japonica]
MEIYTTMYLFKGICYIHRVSVDAEQFLHDRYHQVWSNGLYFKEIQPVNEGELGNIVYQKDLFCTRKTRRYNNGFKVAHEGFIYDQSIAALRSPEAIHQDRRHVFILLCASAPSLLISFFLKSLAVSRVVVMTTSLPNSKCLTTHVVFSQSRSLLTHVKSGTNQSSRASLEALRLVTVFTISRIRSSNTTLVYQAVTTIRSYERWSRSHLTGTEVGGSTSPICALNGAVLGSIDTVGFFVLAWNVLAQCGYFAPGKLFAAHPIVPMRP